MNNNEIVVTSKRDSQLFLKSESSVSNLEERLSVMKRSSTLAKSTVSGTATPKNSAGLKHGKHMKKSPTKKLSVLRPEETKSDEEDITEEDEEEDEEEEDSPNLPEHHYEEGATAEIEEWLANHKIGISLKLKMNNNNWNIGDVPSISKTAFVQEFIKDDMNIDMLISFVVDPRFHKVTDNVI